MLRAADPRGRPVYWVGPAGEGADAGEGTDFHAVANGYVSVTPLQVDLTRHTALEEIGEDLAARAIPPMRGVVRGHAIVDNAVHYIPLAISQKPKDG